MLYALVLPDGTTEDYTLACVVAGSDESGVAETQGFACEETALGVHAVEDLEMLDDRDECDGQTVGDSSGHDVWRYLTGQIRSHEGRKQCPRASKR